MNNCRHKLSRIKRNFPFGRNSAPRRHCKDCGKIMSALDIKNNKPKKRVRK